jgi:formylglycine-generating enzyme required for sulfatase activity
MIQTAKSQANDRFHWRFLRVLNAYRLRFRDKNQWGPKLMTPCFLIAAAVLVAEPTPEQLALLKTFREEFIQVTPGKGLFPESFVMGSDAGPSGERPAHRVAFAYDFHIARYEVPQNLWEAVMGDNPSRWKGPRNSVEMLSWEEAQSFCRRATNLMQAAGLIEKTQQIRLPSEAEWEYVARAGTNTRYSFGDDAGSLNEYAWHTGNAAGNDPPVGAKKPNPWGLYDIHGYLWEWCADKSWHASYNGAPGDGASWDEEGDPERRVLRGGSWKDQAAQLASSFRRPEAAGLRDDAVGLRCLLAEK